MSILRFARFPRLKAPAPLAPSSLRTLFLLRALMNREAVNSLFHKMSVYTYEYYTGIQYKHSNIKGKQMNIKYTAFE